MTYVVLLQTGRPGEVPAPYGPFDDLATAEHFADFLTTEVDPAVVREMRSPIKELLTSYRSRESQSDDDPWAVPKPVNWPPSPGSLWKDREGDRWMCVETGSSGTSYLVCINKRGDDGADEIWKKYGPLAYLHSIALNDDEEPPF